MSASLKVCILIVHVPRAFCSGVGEGNLWKLCSEGRVRGVVVAAGVVLAVVLVEWCEQQRWLLGVGGCGTGA